MIALIRRARARVRSWLYPPYDCECCVGQDAWQGCYCAYYGGVAPNHGPEGWRALLRRLFRMNPPCGK